MSKKKAKKSINSIEFVSSAPAVHRERRRLRHCLTLLDVINLVDDGGALDAVIVTRRLLERAVHLAFACLGRSSQRAYFTRVISVSLVRILSSGISNAKQ